MGIQLMDVIDQPHSTTSEISRGGQGVVYRTQNANIAIKVELDSNGAELSKDVSRNKRFDDMRLLPISSNVNITLPMATLKDYAGYVMTLLDDMDSFEKAFDYSFDLKCDYLNTWLEQFTETAPDFVEVFAQYINSGGRRRRLESYLRVACMLSELHSVGLVYCDFSAKNAFVSNIRDNKTVWLIDADNLDFQEKTIKSGYYTPGYGAPEVVKGRGCTFYSDAYAFAVSLFWQLTGTHPFKGAMVEGGESDDFADDFVDDKEDLAYSGDLPWIMDLEDDSNYIDTRIQQDFVVSKRLIRLFDRTFCAIGKEKRHTRPTMFEWSEALATDLDMSISCKYCGMNYDESYDKCPWCDSENCKIILKANKKNKSVWKYIHELEDGKVISIPLRIINGFKNKEIEKNAFKMKIHDSQLSIFDLSEMYEWSVSTDKGTTFAEIYGSAIIPTECIVKSVDNKNGNIVIIEVGVL